MRIPFHPPFRGTSGVLHPPPPRKGSVGKPCPARNDGPRVRRSPGARRKDGPGEDGGHRPRCSRVGGGRDRSAERGEPAEETGDELLRRRVGAEPGEGRLRHLLGGPRGERAPGGLRRSLRAPLQHRKGEIHGDAALPGGGGALLRFGRHRQRHHHLRRVGTHQSVGSRRGTQPGGGGRRGALPDATGPDAAAAFGHRRERKRPQNLGPPPPAGTPFLRQKREERLARPPRPNLGPRPPVPPRLREDRHLHGVPPGAALRPQLAPTPPGAGDHLRGGPTHRHRRRPRGDLGGGGQRSGGRGRHRPAPRASAAVPEGGGGGGAGAAVSPPPPPRRLLRPRPPPPRPPPPGQAPVPQGLSQVPPDVSPAEHPPGLGGRGGGAPSPRSEGGGGGGGRAVGRHGDPPHPPRPHPHETGQKTEDFGALRPPTPRYGAQPLPPTLHNAENGVNNGVFSPLCKNVAFFWGGGGGGWALEPLTFDL